MTKHYNKLVRDKIPEIIEKAGKTPVTHILSEEDYMTELDKMHTLSAEVSKALR